VAGIISIGDLLILLGSLADDPGSPGGAIFMLVVFSAQAAIAIWAVRSRSRSPV
jgi:hypothetical protein